MVGGISWSIRTYHTTIILSTGETALSLVYGSKALILAEIGERILWFAYTNDSNNEVIACGLSWWKEKGRWIWLESAQKQLIERYHNKKVDLGHFKVGAYVLWSIFAASQEQNTGNLGLNQEEYYRITEISHKEPYKLEEMDAGQ